MIYLLSYLIILVLVRVSLLPMAFFWTLKVPRPQLISMTPPISAKPVPPKFSYCNDSQPLGPAYNRFYVVNMRKCSKIYDPHDATAFFNHCDFLNSS